MMNLPEELGMITHESLYRDVLWANTDKCSHLSEVEREKWNLDYIITLTKKREIKKKKFKVLLAKQLNHAEKRRPRYKHLFAEDKIFSQFSKLTAIFPSSDCSTLGREREMFELNIINFKEFPQILQGIKQQRNKR